MNKTRCLICGKSVGTIVFGRLTGYDTDTCHDLSTLTGHRQPIPLRIFNMPVHPPLPKRKP